MRGGMTAPSWPPEDHPIEKWSDHELLDQYRYVQGELSDEEPETENGPLNALVEEIGRRGLSFLADEIEPDPSSAGRERET